jgi:hypothetical protein
MQNSKEEKSKRAAQVNALVFFIEFNFFFLFLFEIWCLRFGISRTRATRALLG